MWLNTPKETTVPVTMSNGIVAPDNSNVRFRPNIDGSVDVFLVKDGKYEKIKPTLNKGILRTTCIFEGKKQCYYIHTLIGKCLLPNPNNYKYIRFKDGNKLNINLNNMEWTNSKPKSTKTFDVNDLNVIPDIEELPVESKLEEDIEFVIKDVTEEIKSNDAKEDNKITIPNELLIQDKEVNLELEVSGIKIKINISNSKK